jgi:hypothetical protein
MQDDADVQRHEAPRSGLPADEEALDEVTSVLSDGEVAAQLEVSMASLKAELRRICNSLGVGYGL